MHRHPRAKKPMDKISKIDLKKIWWRRMEVILAEKLGKCQFFADK